MSNPYGEFLEWEQFLKAFDGKSPLATLTKAGRAIENLPKFDLEPLVHLLYNKWPQNINEQVMKNGIRRAVQARFYEQLFHHPASLSIKDRDEMAVAQLCLSDIPYEHPKKVEKAERPQRVHKPKPEASPENQQAGSMSTSVPPKKEKQPKSEFQEKVAGMSITELIAWAISLDIPAEKIDKHRDKPIGLAKMNISNMIRARI